MGLQKQYLKVGQSAKNRLFGVQPNVPAKKAHFSSAAHSRNTDTRPLQMMVSDQNKISNSKWYLLSMHLFFDITDFPFWYLDYLIIHIVFNYNTVKPAPLSLSLSGCQIAENCVVEKSSDF